MNLTIDLNTVIFIAGQIITLLVLIISVNEKLKTICKNVEQNTFDISDLYEKHTHVVISISKIEGGLERGHHG